MKFRVATMMLGLATALGATSFQAQAADVARPVVLPPPPNPFEGFYVGGNVGWAKAKRNGCSMIFSGVNDFTCNDEYLSFPFHYKQDGGLIGAQVGINHTSNYWGHNWVWGSEVSADLSGLSGQLRNQFPGYNGTGDWNWLALGLVKLGLQWSPHWMIYADAGGALGEFRFNSGACNFTSNNKGWAAGAGIAWAVSNSNNWFLDWQHIDFERKTAFCGDAPVPFNGFDTEVRTKPKIDIVRVGFNHQFH